MHDHDLVEVLDVALRVGDAQDDVWIDCQSPRGSILSYSVAGTVAKAIIGMANRALETARNWNDGVGYVVVGMEKGNVPGIRQVSPDKLAEALRPYLGEDPPDWRPRWVVFRGAHLLVIEVPAAGPGAAIYCLNREYDKEARASIYVRHPGRTALATPEELVRLTERARGRALRGVTAELACGTAHQVDLSSDSVQAWLTRERVRLLAPIANIPEKSGAPIGVAVARLRSQRERLGRRIDAEESHSMSQPRTVEAYRREVAEYLSVCARLLPAAARSGTGWLAPVRLRLVNTTPEFWSQVVLTLQLPEHAWALIPDDVQLADGAHRKPPLEPQRLGLPRPPQAFGPHRAEAAARMSGAAGGSKHAANREPANREAAGREPAVTEVAASSCELSDSGQVRFPATDLRPGATLELAPLVLSTTDPGQFNVAWNLTGTVRGVISGTLAMPVAEQTWTATDLIAASHS